MYSQANTTKRTTPARKGGTGIKAFIMAASLAVTIGGWGILAVGQAANAVAAGQPAQPATSATNTTSQSALRTTGSSASLSQSTAFVSRPSAVARTRSSR